MSEGPRLSLPVATKAAEYLMRLWQMPTPDSLIVGSIRRRKPTVGDVEIIAPWPGAGNADPLYERIAETIGVGGDGLFGAVRPEPVLKGRALEGLKPGFKACALHITLKRKDRDPPEPIEVPVQIFRYVPGATGNRGWVELMRTGPGEFGEWFLWRWKEQHHIPIDRKASRDGFLVDEAGEVVPTPAEADCFAEVGLPVVAPERREEYVERKRRERGG